ncbi:MAG: DNRLRE domain-containing protein [Planctomycetota bacterium]
MVIMRYCGVCGKRVDQEDIDAGRSAEDGDLVWCGEHQHLAPNQRPSQKRSGRLSPESKKTTNIHVSKRKTSAIALISGKANPNPPRRKTHAHGVQAATKADDSSGNGLMVFGLIITVVVIAGLVWLMFYGGSDEMPIEEPLHTSQPDKTESLPNEAQDKTITNSGSRPEPRLRLKPQIPPDYTTGALVPRLSPTGETATAPTPNLTPVNAVPEPVTLPVTVVEAAPANAETLILKKDQLILNGTSGQHCHGDHFIDNQTYSGTLKLESKSSDGTGVSRAFIKFNFASIPSDAKIFRAYLNLKLFPTNQRTTGSMPHRIRVGLLDKDIETISPRGWETLEPLNFIDGTYTDTVFDSVGEPYQYEELDATKAVQAICEGRNPNNGFIMRFADEDTSGHKKHAWCSSFHQGGAHAPELIIIYTRQSSEPMPPPITPTATIESGSEQSLLLAKPDIILNGSCGKDNDGDHFTGIDALSSTLYLESGSPGSPDSVARTYIKFNLSKVPKEAAIISAKLNLRSASLGGRKGPFPQRVRAGLLNTDLESVATRNWSTLRPLDVLGSVYNDTDLLQPTPPMEIDAIDVTNAIKAVIEGGQPNNGIILRFADENQINQHYKYTFISTFHQGGRYSPELVIRYELKAQ